MIGIYRIYHKKTGKSYIGQSINIEKRIKAHFVQDSRSYIYNAIHKHNQEDFNWEIIEVCSENELNDRECHWIAALDCIRPNGYNLKTGGANGKPSKASRQKMSKAHSGKNCYWYGKSLSVEHRKKISDAQRGKNHHMFGKKRPEHGKKISKIQTGRKLSEETKRKIGDANRKYWKKRKKSLSD